MENEEKAEQIAQYHCSNKLNLIQAYNSALDMAEWKDEQFAKEKQQWLDKACEWINDNYFEYLQPISYYEQLQNSIDINDFVNDLKKILKGE